MAVLKPLVKKEIDPLAPPAVKDFTVPKIKAGVLPSKDKLVEITEDDIPDKRYPVGSNEEADQQLNLLNGIPADGWLKRSPEDTRNALQRIKDKTFAEVDALMQPKLFGDSVESLQKYMPRFIAREIAQPISRMPDALMRTIAVPFIAGFGAMEASLVEMGMDEDDAKRLRVSAEIALGAYEGVARPFVPTAANASRYNFGKDLLGKQKVKEAVKEAVKPKVVAEPAVKKVEDKKPWEMTKEEFVKEEAKGMGVTWRNAVKDDEGTIHVSSTADHGDMIPALEEQGLLEGEILPQHRGWIWGKDKNTYIDAGDLEITNGDFHQAYINKYGAKPTLTPQQSAKLDRDITEAMDKTEEAIYESTKPPLQRVLDEEDYLLSGKDPEPGDLVRVEGRVMQVGEDGNLVDLPEPLAKVEDPISTAVRSEVVANPAPLVDETTIAKFPVQLSKAVTDTGADIMIAAGIKRNDKVNLNQQIMEVINSHTLSNENISDIMANRGVTPEQFRAEILGPYGLDIRESAQKMNFLSQAGRRLDAIAGTAESDAALLAAREAGGFDYIQMMKNTADNILEAPRTINRLWRGMLVTQLATASRNFTSQVGRIGMDVVSRGVEKGLQRIFNPEAYTTGSPIDAFGEFSRIFRPSKAQGVKKDLDFIFSDSKFVEARAKLFQNFNSDIDKIDRRAGSIMSYADKGVEVANIVNRFQEFLVRRAVVHAELTRDLAGKGLDLDAIIRTNAVRSIPSSSMEAAVEKGLQMTLSQSMEGNKVAQGITNIVNSRWGAWLGISYDIPYPRFIMNSLKFTFDYSPLGPLQLLSKAERSKVAEGNMKVMANAIVGTASLLAAYQLRTSKYAGEKWYELRTNAGEENERTIDARPFAPFVAQLFIADMIRKTVDGTIDEVDSKEVIEAVTGLSRVPGTELGVYDKIIASIKNEEDAESVKQIFKDGLGEIAGGFATPFTTIRDLFAEFDRESARVKDMREQGSFAPGNNKMPAPMRTQELPNYQNPIDSRPQEREETFLRQITGITVIQPKTRIQKELDEYGFTPQEILAKTSEPDWDRLMAANMAPRAELVLNRLFEKDSYKTASRALKAELIRRELIIIRDSARRKTEAARPDLAKKLNLDRQPSRFKKVIKEVKPELYR